MRLTLSQTFTFDAAHTLDRGESSRRVHGHTYHAEIGITAAPNQDTGMLVDLDQLRNVCEGVRDALDHRLLDDVEGLGPATLENLCLFIASRLSRFQALAHVRVWRADGGACLLQLPPPEPC
jgi:6-pyruvoyltetrahydropterin/6-carboxytetrahydropterin synthase